MPFDRSKFKGVAPEILQEQQKRMEELNPYSNRSGFVKLTPGVNTIRVFPPHREGASYAYPKAVSWLPFMEEVEDKKKNTKNMEEVRRPIFNSRYHAGSPKDLVEEYIKFSYKLFTDEIQDETEREKKLKPILDWRMGIKTQIAWIFYGKKLKSDGTKEFGRVEVTNGLMEKFNKIAARVSESGQPMTIDCFSGANDGKAVQIMWNKDEPDNKKKYEPTLLHEKEWKLTDEELIEFVERESLEDIYTNCFVRTDFEKQVRGLQNFDDKHGFGIFQHDEFLETAEEISDYLEEKVFPITDAKNVASDQAESGENDLPFEGEENNTHEGTVKESEPVKTEPVKTEPAKASTAKDGPAKPGAVKTTFIKKTPPPISPASTKGKSFMEKYKNR